MKPRHIAMGVALAVSAALVAFGDRSPEVEVAEAVERPGAVPAPVAPARSTTAAPSAEPDIKALVPRETLIGDGKDRFGADEHALFGRQDWTPPPPPPPKPAPPPPPSAPPLPFTFIGKSLEDGKWEVYLAVGDRTHMASEGATLEGSWRVDRIAPPIMTLTYLPLNQVQQLNIGVFE
ncbi:hypothetical protein [Massilia sp. SYSU DXS3249]